MTVAQAVDQLSPNTELVGQTIAHGLGGLRSADGRAFPLQRVRVRTSIAGPCARTVIEQTFANLFDETLDVTWIFPLPGEGAITALELRAGDIVVRGECQTREDAHATFQAARAIGMRTALVETEQRGVHTLSLAGLPPRSDVTVQLTIVELLPVVDARFRWQFPTTIAPRYTPGVEWNHSGFGTSPDTDAVPNASRLTPPIRLAGGTILDLEVEIAGPVRSLESSLHAVKLSLDSGHVRVAPSAVTTLNRDFILEFSTADSSATSSRAYTDGTYTVAIVEPPSTVNTRALPRDAVFVVDISGSMQGVKLDAAKVALIGALHGLQRDDRFKLLAFDDRVEHFKANFVDYNDQNVHEADAWIASLHSRGGTEMLAAIQESLAGDTPSGRLRTVLFITDGQSNDESRLLPAVANRRGNAVLFTLGIDTAVNESLLKLLAKAGGGACELCTPSDDIEAIVAKLETRFGSPLLSDVQVSGAARPDGQTVFTGRPAMMLVEGAPAVLNISAMSPTGEFSASIVPEHIEFSLGALWARERVSWLEERLMLRPFEEEAIKPEIVRIALAHHIASKFTSFVCVDRSVRTHGDRRHVVQPVEVPQQWEEALPVMPMHMRMMPSPAPMQAARYASSARPFPNSEIDDSQSISMPAAGAPNSAMQLGSSIRDAAEKIFSFGKKLGMTPSRHPSPKSANTESLRSNESVDYSGILARTQNADGSYGNDIGRSAAALLALLLLGCTRSKGDRRRTVKKLVDWLKTQREDARAIMALDALREAEASPSYKISVPHWNVFTKEGEEGKMLKELLAKFSAS
ncbi:MAG: VIT domain-containing protein [Gemmatimonadaceae bacterium]